jgi:hypothetical protein
VATTKDNQKQNVTISLDRKIIQRARIVTARRSTSISGLLARQVEILVGEEEAYERAERQATTLLDQAFTWEVLFAFAEMISMSDKTLIDHGDIPVLDRGRQSWHS